MSGMVTIHLENAIGSVKTLDDTAASAEASSAEPMAAERLESQKESLVHACRALEDAVAKINEFQKNLFESSKEQIAKLSVEIARKILVQEVQEGDYEIESIVKEALKNAPTHQDVVVHLNPEDLVQFQKVQQDDPASCGTLAGIKFVADPNIGLAECLLESPKGIIESSINEHLERIGKALENSG